MSTTGTIATTNISPSKPLVNMGLRCVFATYKEATPGAYTLDFTKNHLHGLKIGNVSVGDTNTEQIELPGDTIPGMFKRFIEGAKTGGDVKVDFPPDPDIGFREPPPLPMSGGLPMEPHGVLLIGFLDATAPAKMICYGEMPVNIKGEKGITWNKNTPAESSATFQITGEGSRFGRNVVAKTIDYIAPV